MRLPVQTLLTTLALCLPLAAGAKSPDPQALNWLVNGDFAAADGWGKPVVPADGPRGLRAAALENAQPAWNGYQQKVTLPQPAPPALEISGWMANTGVVPGGQDWQKARITVVFYDAAGQRAGNWPAPAAQAQGSREWTRYSNQYEVPKDAARADIALVLDNCVGRAAFADVRCLVYDFDDQPLPRGAAATHPERAVREPKPTDNWLLNPGFEVPGSRDWTGGQVAPSGRQSVHALTFDNPVPAWNQASQMVGFKQAGPRAVVLGGWVRTRGVVVGDHPWEAARIGIDFRDAGNKQVGGWQDTVCKVSGDTDWAYVEKRYAVPDGAVAASVDAGLGHCLGQADFDDLSLRLLDADGKALTTVAADRLRTDTHDWWAYTPPKDPAGTALDLSYLNDKPAGRHGFARIKNGHFVFADGARARFWGTDFVGPNHFLEKGQADQVAHRLARLGVNLVRLHMPDAAWSDSNLFDPAADNTLVLNPSQLDKYDYLVAALKKEGIYVYPDWMVARRFRAGDGVKDYAGLDDGAKGAVHFDPRIIALNKLYATQLLGHKNPYTGLALKDDPAYVANEIVNESSIFSGFGEQKLPESYWRELEGMYHADGGSGPLTRFKFDWDSKKLVPVANPDNAGPSLRFLLKRLTRSDLEMKAFQSKLSPHALLAGSNMGLPVLGDIQANARLDYMDTHAYFDHPQFWNIPGGWSDVQHAPMNNTAQLRAPFDGALIPALAQAAVEGKPLLVTEWNDCVPNDYRLEGPVLMAAYGSLQDWDGLLQFDSTPALPGTSVLTNFGINTRPDNEPLYQAGALIFRLGLLKPAPQTVVEPLSDQAVLADGMRAPWLLEHPWLPYVTRVAKRFTGAKTVAPPSLAVLDSLHDAQAKTVESQTHELLLDYGQGRLRVDSPRVQGFAGAIGVDQPLATKDLSLRLAARNPWAAVLAISLGPDPLASSPKILLVAVARAENSGQTYNPTRTALRDVGSTPVLMQGVEGVVNLAVPAGQYRVRPLDSDGNAAGSVAAQYQEGQLTFPLAPGDHSCYYLVERQP